MASVTSTGIGSGLDVNTIVSSLMAVEQRPLQNLQTQASTIQTKISAFGNLQSQIAALSDVATRLATATNWAPMQADSNDSTSVSATATATAAVGTHAIEVQQLAQSQVLASGTYGSSASVVGTGTLTIDIGTTSGGTFTPRTGTLPSIVTIDSSKNTLAGIRDAINAANAGVTASIVNGAAGARLVLRGADGADSSVRVKVADDDGTATDTAGLSALAWDPAAPAGAGANLGQTQVAQDAKFTVDGVSLTSATNAPSTALDGVTLTLKKVTTAPVSLALSVTTMAVRKNVNDFVNAWNALNTQLRNQTQVDPTGKTRGPLQADSTAETLLNGLRSLLGGSLTGATGVSSLAAAGIELQRDGSLLVNDARLTPLLSQPDRLGQLFSQAKSGSDDSTRGFAVRFKEWTAGLTGTDGVLTSRLDGLKRSATDNQNRQSTEQDRLDRTETRLRAVYQQLDTQMSTLNAQMARMKSSLGLA
jgi:flagellar hook-associated protein 2